MALINLFRLFISENCPIFFFLRQVNSSLGQRIKGDGVDFRHFFFIEGLPGHPKIISFSDRWVESYNFRGVGAADKAAIQLIKVQSYQLLVSDT